MTGTNRSVPPLWRRLPLWLWGVVLLLLAAASCLLLISWRVRQQALRDESRPADVIVVLGAAEYRGFPSPILKARLDHALDLYHKGYAPRILTTGGAGGDPLFTEGEVGRDYLMQNGVPSEAIIVEREGESTIHSMVAAAEIMHRMSLTTAVVVSDGYHVFRAKRMLEAQGIVAYGSPRPPSTPEGLRQQLLYVRQAAGYILWSLGISI